MTGIKSWSAAGWFFLGMLGVATAALEPGQRPGPYAFVISTGPNRGKMHCYICETADKPGVVIFARSLSDPLGKLVQQIDKALTTHEKAELRAWVTFLHEDQTSVDPQVVQWSQKYALRNVPVGVFEDAGGPPSYRLSRGDDVTALLFVKQKVVASFTYRSGELNDAAITTIMKALPQILADKK